MRDLTTLIAAIKAADPSRLPVRPTADDVADHHAAIKKAAQAMEDTMRDLVAPLAAEAAGVDLRWLDGPLVEALYDALEPSVSNRIEQLRDRDWPVVVPFYAGRVAS